MKHAYDEKTTTVYNLDTMKIPNIEYKILPTTLNSCGSSVCSVLDLGCGNGEYYRRLSLTNPKISLVVAVELSEAQLNLCKTLDKKAGITHVQYILADIFSSQSFGGLFDVIILSFVLSHAKNEKEFQTLLENVHRHLAPHGRVVINHSVGMIPKELVPDVYDYLGTIYSSLPESGLPLIGQPYSVRFGGKAETVDYFFPIRYIKLQLQKCGFHHVEVHPWIEQFPPDLVRPLPSQKLQRWLDEGNQIAYHLTASILQSKM